MNCKYCGEKVAEGAKFCENCGNKIEENLTENIENKVEETVNETVNETKEYKEPERVDAEVVEEGARANTSGTQEGNFAPHLSQTASTPSSDMGPIGYSIASLVCGILGLLCCCCGIFGVVISGAGIALGIISIKKNCEGRGMAIAGIVCGGIGALFALISVIVSFTTGNFGLDNASDVTNQLEDFLDSL